MRPVRLRFSGLRSYRSDAEIDFTGLDLFAIIGDTGAGKSTIIEALCLALYGKKSWSGGIGITDLIADGQDVMRIELEFTADGHPWKVTRARQRSGSSPVDKLESLDKSAPNVDQSRPVTEKIEALIGLNLQQFTRAVVMPQGRFDELLQATETERNKILASILGHGDLEAVQGAARKVRDTVVPTASELEGARKQLPADPAAARSSATTAVAEAEKRASFLTERNEQVAQPAALASALATVLPALGDAIAAVPTFATEPTAQLQALTALYESLGGQRETAEQAATASAERVASCDTEIADALAGFSDRDHVLLTRTQLSESAAELPGDLARLADAERAVAELEADPPAAAVDEQLTTQLTGATEQLAKSEASRRSADEAVAAARTAWTVLVDARRDAAAAATNAAALDAERDAKAGAVTAAQRLADDQAALVEKARTAVADAEQANRVAAIAGDHQPGDDCPVCAQVLPDGFHVAGAADLGAAKQELADARKAHQGADASARAASNEHVTATERASNAADREAICVAAATAAQAAAEALDVDTVAADDDDALSRVLVVAGTAKAEYDTAAELERSARRAVDGAEATLRSRIESYEGDLVRARRDVVAARERVDRHGERCASLPAGWSPEPADCQAPDALAAVALRLDEAVSALDRLSGERNEAHAGANSAQGEVARITAEITDQVTRPAERAVRSTTDHVSAVAAACRSANVAALAVDGGSIDVPGTADLPEDVMPEAMPTLAATVSGILDGSAVALTAARAIADGAAEAHSTAEAAVEAALDGTACATVGELNTAVSLAGNDLQHRRHEFATIDAQATEAEATDAKLAVIVPLRENLDVLVASLANRQFVDHLLNLREAELLAEASRRLRDISGDRFAFAPEFGVVSTASGQVRSPDALSGGERFQASLALALALVEIASRGGGRLDAVFVDEGFGSLDANALDDALDALGKVAGGGKMVALISHLRSVAEYVDTVIHVSRDDVLGSSVTLLTEAERDELLSDDVHSRLTS